MSRAVAAVLALSAWALFVAWLLRRAPGPAGIGDPDETTVIDMREVRPSELIPGRWTA